MKNKSPLTSLALLLLTLAIVVGTVATLVATDGSEQVRMAILEVSSTPRSGNTGITIEPPTNSTQATPILNDSNVEPTPTVPTLPPESGCAAAPSQFGATVNIRKNPGVDSDIIGSMDFRWYPQDTSKPPAVADDGNEDDSDGNLWFAVKMPNGDTGWVARRVVQTSQPDCFGNGVLVTCTWDIQTLAPEQLPSHDIIFFGDNCDLIEEMLYENTETDDLQSIIAGEGSCSTSAISNVYLGARTMLRGGVPTSAALCNPTLLFIKSADPIEVEVDGSVTYTITVTNNGDGKAKNIVISDSLPAGAVLVSCSSPCTPNNSDLRWEIGDLKPGESDTRDYTLQFPDVTPGTSIINSATIFFQNYRDEPQDSQTASVKIKVVGETTQPTSVPALEGTQPLPTMSPIATATPTATATQSQVPIPADTFALFVEQSKSDASQTKIVFIGPDRYVAFTYLLSIEGPIHYPALSPDRRKVAFLQNTINGWVLNSLTLPTSEDGEVQQDEMKELPLLFPQNGLSIAPSQIAWSPDSNILLITMRDADGVNNVYWVDADQEASPLERMHGLFIADASQPAYSPSMHPEVENDGLIAVVRSGRILITRHKPTLLHNPNLTDDQVVEWQIVIEDNLRSLPETPSCASQSQPAFNYSDEYSLYFVCERGGAGVALYLYTGGEPQQMDLSLEISPIQNLGPLRGWYITFDDGEEIYMVRIEPDTTNVLETISLDLSSQRRNALYMSWLSIAEPLS